jgi:asparagine synthase (glutamine-hydrolysing)
LLAFLPADEGAPAPPGFEKARAFLERQKGLPIAGETATAVKYRRLNGSGSGIAVSAHGWLLAGGSWVHPGCGIDDPPALLARLEEEGESVLDDLDGFYAVVWHDARSKTLLVAPDHVGRYRVYFAEAPEGTYVSTSPIALAAAVPSAPDPVAVWELLAAGLTYEDRSPFAGVRRMVAAHRYRFRRGRLAAYEPVAPLRVPGPESATPDAGPDELFEACLAAVRERLTDRPRPLPDLTGGNDSRFIVGLLLAAGVDCDVTVTGDRGDPDVEATVALARQVGLKLLRVPLSEIREAQRSFAQVLRAATRVDGGYDAIEYAATAHVHEAHAKSYDFSLNGSGGETVRRYWWHPGLLGRTVDDKIGNLLPRFRHAATPTVFLDAAHVRDANAHFHGLLSRELAGRLDESLHHIMVHAHLHLKVQPWQGAIASASNQIWPNLSIFYLRRTLDVAMRIPPRERVSARAFHAMLRRMPRPFRTSPLYTGFPPMSPDATNFWRFLPGLLRLPGRAWEHFRGPRPDPAAAVTVRHLLHREAGDFLVPREMALQPFLDRARLEDFLDAGRRHGEVPLPLLGRLISLEHALRAAAAAARG